MGFKLANVDKVKSFVSLLLDSDTREKKKSILLKIEYIEPNGLELLDKETDHMYGDEFNHYFKDLVAEYLAKQMNVL